MLWLCADAVGEIQSNVDELNKKVSRLSDMTDNLINKLIGFGFDLLIAILIFIAGKFILKLLRKIFKNIMSKSNVDIGVIKFGDSIIRAIGYVIILIIICGQIGIQTTSFITLLGTAGLSIGFALEGCLSNFAGGVLILVTKPFVVGDYILINSTSDNVEGTVDKIDIIYTTLTTIDNKAIKIPNGTVSNSVLTNFTHQTKRRVDVQVGIHYADDISKAQDLADKVMRECQYILKKEENMVVVKKLGDSSVILEVRMWSLTENYWKSVFYLNQNIKETFDKNGITIPYNQLDVHLHQNND